MYYSTRPRWDIPDPNNFPLALHNTRYNGWPKPPIQLPHVAAPSFKKPAEQHVTFALNTPSNRRPVDGNAIHTQPYSMHLQLDTHPRANSGAQGISPLLRFALNPFFSVGIMWPVEYQSHDVSDSCTWNGGQNPSLQGVFETRTAARHHKENAAIKRKCPRSFSYDCQDVELRAFLDDPARRTKISIPLIDKDTQIAYLLAAPCAQLVNHWRYPPNSLYFPPSSSYAGWGSEFLRVLTLARHNRIRLISQDFPWAFNISPEPSAAEQGVTCLDVLNALHAALQRPFSDTEWGAAAQDKQASLIRARDRQLNMKPALWL
ncbi:uncharacterized protein HD556DRAFT_1444019 [Suillus plorans]|uniref:DUF6699 domain-containing protein n=1 Tax=Suillus plorans TaxID=116603 RepID=A0A9P7AN84_9AGAM|nr:uncharacterized protein HD556DRAFT_1444019 [Suillus plorans]KAG1792939.1 hypothetical protein HD556DRAFT_1444019 [Suillus plorans]